MSNSTDTNRKQPCCDVDPEELSQGSLVAGLLPDASGPRTLQVDGATGGLRVVSVGGELSGDVDTGPATYVSVALEESACVLAAPGRIHRVDMIVPSAPGLRYLHIFDLPEGFDLTTLAGTVPVWRAALPASAVQVTVGLAPGLVIRQRGFVAISTTAATFTGGGAIALFHTYHQVDLRLED